MEFSRNEDIFKLIFLKNIIDDYYRNSDNPEINLNLGYLPFSRMDRENDNYVFTLKIMTKMINDLKFNTIRIIEPHSNVAPALLNKCYIYYETPYLIENIIKKVMPYFKVVK